MKTLRRIILAATVLVLLLGLGVYMAVKIALPPGKIRTLISAKGSEALGRKVEVGEIRIRMFPQFKISVSEVNVANAPGFSADPVIKLRELDLSLNFLSLLRFSPEIQEIKIVSPEILYEINAAGHNNLEGLGKPDTTAPKVDTATGPLEIPGAVALHSFVILDGKVRYRDAVSGRELILGRINQQVSLMLDPRLQNVVSTGRLEITEVSVRDSAFGIRTGNLRVYLNHDLRLDLPGENLQVKKLELVFQDIHVQLDGTLSQFKTKAPTIDFNVSAPSIPLASVLREIPVNLSPELPKLKAGGQASFHASIKGKLDSGSVPVVNAEVQVKGGTLSHSDIPLGIERLELNVALRGDSLRLQQLAFDMGKNPVRVEASVRDIRKIPFLEKLRVDATLDLGSLTALAQRIGMLDPTLKISGTEVIQFQASGLLDPANPHNLTANGTALIQKVAVSLPGKPTMSFDGKVQINNDRIQQDLAAKIGQSDVSLKVDIVNYLALALPKLAKGGRAQVKATIKSGYLDLDELMPPSKPVATKESAPPMTAYPPLPPVDADVSVDLARTRLLGLEMTRFELRTSARAKNITTNLKGTVYSGRFSSSATLLPKSATDMGVTFKLDAVQVEANDFISRLNDRVPVGNRLFKSLAQADSLIFGKLNLNLNVATFGLPHEFANNLTGTILFALADGKLMESGLTQGFSGALSKVNSSLGFKQLSFGGLKSDLKVENGKLVIRDFHIDNSPIGMLQALGHVGFDNALNLQLTQALPPGISKLVGGASSALAGQLAKAAPGMGLEGASLVPTDKSGRTLLYFVVGGLLAKPTFALDTQRMAKEGVGSAKSAIADALRQKQDELKNHALAEKQKLEAEAKAKLDAEKKKLEEKAQAEKNKATDEAKKQGKKVLKNLGL